MSDPVTPAAPEEEVTPPVAPATPEETPSPAPAPEETAPAAPASSAATPVVASNRVGVLSAFFARATGIDGEVNALRQQITERDVRIQQLESANRELRSKVDSYASLEKELETAMQQAAAAQDVPRQIATAVQDVVSGLGVEETVLPQSADLPPKGSAGEFAHLKGRERAAAAFNAQLVPA